MKYLMICAILLCSCTYISSNDATYFAIGKQKLESFKIDGKKIEIAGSSIEADVLKKVADRLP